MNLGVATIKDVVVGMAVATGADVSVGGMPLSGCTDPARAAASPQPHQGRDGPQLEGFTPAAAAAARLTEGSGSCASWARAALARSWPSLAAQASSGAAALRAPAMCSVSLAGPSSSRCHRSRLLSSASRTFLLLWGASWPKASTALCRTRASSSCRHLRRLVMAKPSPFRELWASSSTATALTPGSSSSMCTQQAASTASSPRWARRPRTSSTERLTEKSVSARSPLTAVMTLLSQYSDTCASARATACRTLGSVSCSCLQSAATTSASPCSDTLPKACAAASRRPGSRSCSFFRNR
mmetsp:Transcript_83448/g.253179  ORF Transcript_83448/g.253179 Transcript_83448/m.253179 type:complete len:298 (-) Transcript_83448:960-1853(-)